MQGVICTISLLQELSTLIQINEDDIEEKVQSNTADLEVRKVKNKFCYVGKQMFFVISDPEYKSDVQCSKN